MLGGAKWEPSENLGFYEATYGIKQRGPIPIAQSRFCTALNMCQIQFVIFDHTESPVPVSSDFIAGCFGIIAVCSRL
jgi:hypothetical protein